MTKPLHFKDVYALMNAYKTNVHFKELMCSPIFVLLSLGMRNIKLWMRTLNCEFFYEKSVWLHLVKVEKEWGIPSQIHIS